MKSLWSKLPYWFKGGVLGLCFAVLSGLSVFACFIAVNPNQSFGLECLLFVAPLIPIYKFIPGFFYLLFLDQLIILTALYFAVGALMGILYSIRKKGLAKRAL